MKTKRTLTPLAPAVTLLFAAVTLTAQPPVMAQETQFPDVAANHWAYAALHDLADKGYVKGYPDGKFLGKAPLSRYEFAAAIDRIAQTLADIQKTQAAAGSVPAATPTGQPVTQDDLNKIQVLADQFRVQLQAIQSDVAAQKSDFQSQINALRQQAAEAKTAAGKAQATADKSYGAGPGRTFGISGFTQVRYQSADSGSSTRFPQGTGTVSGAFNGDYGQGGNRESIQLRRSRLRFSGAASANAKYAIQIDVTGAIVAGTTPNQQVTVRDAYVAYTFGDGSAKYPTLTAGQFINPFGYEMSLGAPSWLTPERPLAFSEATYGLWAAQDYDKGVQLSYGPKSVQLSVSFVNGTGRTSEDVDTHLDSIYRAAYQSPSHVFGIGASYYDGHLPGTAGPTPGSYVNSGKKQLLGVDAQYQPPSGLFALGEYVGGTYERRSYLNDGIPTASFPGTVVGTNVSTSPLPLLTDAYLPGNHIEGYYLQSGYKFHGAGRHPLTLAISYDKFRRSTRSDVTGAATFPTSAAPGAKYFGGASGGSFDDENVGYGVLYNLDPQTRVRFWYDKPDKVAHPAGTPAPPYIGLFTGELQVTY